MNTTKYLLLVFLSLTTVCFFSGCATSDTTRYTSQDISSQSAKDICKVEGRFVCNEDCVDGFEAKCYFDSIKYIKADLKNKFSETDACFAVHTNSVCGKCSNKFELRKNGILEEVSCEEFFVAIERKDIDCDNCLDTISSECC